MSKIKPQHIVIRTEAGFALILDMRECRDLHDQLNTAFGDKMDYDLDNISIDTLSTFQPNWLNTKFTINAELDRTLIVKKHGGVEVSYIDKKN